MGAGRWASPQYLPSRRTWGCRWGVVGRSWGAGVVRAQFWLLGPGVGSAPARAGHRAEHAGGGAGGADDAEAGQWSRGAPHSSPRRPWSCGACGRSRRAWWSVCGASAASCVAGSPGTSAASRDSWTCTACAWWAWGPRPGACRSSWTGATFPEVPAMPPLPPQSLPLSLSLALSPHSGHLRPPPCPEPSLSRRALLLFQFSSPLLLPAAVAIICTPCPDVPPTVDDRVAGPSGDWPESGPRVFSGSAANLFPTSPLLWSL